MLTSSLHAAGAEVRKSLQTQVRRWCVLPAVSLLIAFPAHAEDAPSRVDRSVLTARLVLSLPSNCGSTLQFVERVYARNDHVRLSTNEGERLLQASIVELISGRFVAQMSLPQPNGTVATRTIEARTCDQAIDGLAFVTALSLDQARKAEQAEPRESQASPATGSNVVSPPKRSTFRPITVEPHSVDHRKPETVSFGAELSALGKQGPAPRWLAGVALGADVTWNRNAVFSPAIQLSISLGARTYVARGYGIADFALSAMTLGVCPTREQLGSLVFVQCGTATAGQLTSTGRSTLEPGHFHRPWFAVGASNELRLPIGANFAIPVRISAFAPLVRDRYQFVPRAFHRTPAVGFDVSLGVWLRFW